jgi:predicted Zn-dependent protease
LNGNVGGALRNAEAAALGLKQGTPDWLRAQDIAMEARSAMAKTKKRK